MTTATTVILARHGEAASTIDNPERPLTIVGRQQAERIAGWLAARGFPVDEIGHSSKARARQTAKILGRRLGLPPSRVRERPGLTPDADPAPLVVELEADDRSLALVGHLPLLARLASTMLVGDPDRLDLRFDEAGVVVLSRCRGGWRIDALAGPDTV
ncbi:MAG: phosphohistidine phosphatase SixA [Thermoanaerobaculales bacterium]|jgi:phosphohistidine phosphatase SixA|nr:phosphohistidine phosphatase SixA [Thermoanaerobaculales bacterium]